MIIMKPISKKRLLVSHFLQLMLISLFKHCREYRYNKKYYIHVYMYIVS